MAFLNPTASALLRYWQEGEWRSHFHLLPIKADKLKNLTTCSRDAIASAQITPSTPLKEGIVWIAPFVYQNDEQAVWIPLWVPAQYKNNQLSLTKFPLFPWLPLSQFENSTAKNLFCEPLSLFTEWCLNECLTEEKAYAFDTWQSFYQATLDLLDALSDNQWSPLLAEKGYKDTSKCVIISEAPEITSISPVLQRYLEIDELAPSVSIEETELNEQAYLLCGVNPSRAPLTKNEYALAIKTLMLDKGSLIGIEAPRGSNKEAVIESIVLSKYIYATVHEHTLPVIYRLAPTKNSIGKENIRIDSSLCDDKSQIDDLYHDMMSGLNLAERLCEAKEKELTIDEEIAILQESDEKIEKELNGLLNQQQEIRGSKISLKARLLQWFQTKEDPLSETIRQFKVQRTKIHQKLVETVEKKVAYRQAQQYWRQWCQSHEIVCSGNLLEDIRHAQQTIASHIVLKANSLWQSAKYAHSFDAGENEIFSNWSLYRWCHKASNWVGVENIKTQGDLLVIDCAEQLYPQQLYSLLGMVNQALFFGNSFEFRFSELIDAVTEEQLLAANPLLEDELIDLLQYKGMLISTGNALTLALANSSIKSFTEYGEWRASCALFEIDAKDTKLLSFCNLFHSKKLVFNLGLEETIPSCDGLHFLPTSGQSHSQGIEKINPMEVRAIHAWLVEHKDILRCKSIAIITLFDEQVRLFQSALHELNQIVNVYTVGSLPDNIWDYVLFSSVFTFRDPRPYLFDQNDTFFYSLALRARRGLWVVGDSRLFDPKTHSPSGKLAKYMFEEKKQISTPSIILLNS